MCRNIICDVILYLWGLFGPECSLLDSLLLTLVHCCACKFDMPETVREIIPANGAKEMIPGWLKRLVFRFGRVRFGFHAITPAGAKNSHVLVVHIWKFFHCACDPCAGLRAVRENPRRRHGTCSRYGQARIRLPACWQTFFFLNRVCLDYFVFCIFFWKEIFKYLKY